MSQQRLSVHAAYPSRSVTRLQTITVRNGFIIAYLSTIAHARETRTPNPGHPLPGEVVGNCQPDTDRRA